MCENIDVLYDNNGVRWIQDLREENKDLFYRTERVLTGWGSWPMFSSSLAFEYCGVSGYNSVLNADMVDFCRTFGKAGDYQIRVAYAYG